MTAYSVLASPNPVNETYRTIMFTITGLPVSGFVKFCAVVSATSVHQMTTYLVDTGLGYHDYVLDSVCLHNGGIAAGGFRPAGRWLYITALRLSAVRAEHFIPGFSRPRGYEQFPGRICRFPSSLGRR
jgi:hypothetical protein